MATGTALTVDAGELDAFAARLGTSPAVVRDEVSGMVGRLLYAGQATAVQATPVDTGALRQSWTVLPVSQGTGGQIEGVLANSRDYAPAVNEGRRPGAPMPPPGVLLPWLKRHGIEATAEYPIRRAIARRGIPGRQMTQKAVATILQRLDGDLRTTAGSIADRIWRGE